MSKRGGGGSVVTGLMAAVIIIPFVAAAAYLGPERAWSIARASVLSTLRDPMCEDGPAPLIPTVQVRYDPDGAHGSWEDGSLSVPFEQGPKGTFLLARTTPMVPMQEVRVTHGAVADMVDQHMVRWAAARMGVLTTWSMPVRWVKNDARGRVVLLQEVPDAEYLDRRGFNGIRTTLRRYTPHGVDAIGGSGPDELDGLTTLLADSSRSMMDRHEAVTGLVDVDGVLRCMAVLEVCGARPIDLLWAWHPRHERWTLVLDEVRPGQPDGAAATLFTALDAEPEWRMRKAELLRDCRRVLIAEGEMAREFDRVVRTLHPSLQADRDKMGRVVRNDTNLYRVPLARVEHELSELRQRLLAATRDESR